MTKYIQSNSWDLAEPKWHIGEKRQSLGARTGRVFAEYYVTACNQKYLGGSYGYSITNNRPNDICANCKRIEARR